MTLSKAVKLAVENMISDGLDDVLSTPVEIELLRKDSKIRKKLEVISLKKIQSHLNSSSKKMLLINFPFCLFHMFWFRRRRHLTFEKLP